MNFKVFLTSNAEKDIISIYNYIYFNDSPYRADIIYRKMKDTISKLTNQPERGHIPPELDKIGIRYVKEIHSKPYRIFYQVVKQNVFVLFVLDGRRNIEEILLNKLQH
ncbi:MAG TPA: type II toxin-antitoxin system RelE/ParE family toxin [Chitinispirillaceae bacterium]|nr:type II toxin-antitoxin system RelE/ParE family toxin [Chitinispirillaceae bacterium]